MFHRCAVDFSCHLVCFRPKNLRAEVDKTVAAQREAFTRMFAEGEKALALDTAAKMDALKSDMKRELETQLAEIKHSLEAGRIVNRVKAFGKSIKAMV